MKLFSNKKFLSQSCVIFLFILVLGNTLLVAATDDWTMFGHDKQHTRLSSSSAPESNTILWSFQSNDKITSSPAVVDGCIYVGSYDHDVYCIDGETGTELRRYPTNGNVSSSPAVVDEKVIVGSHDYSVYCFNEATETVLWSFPTKGIVSSSPIVSNGFVYIGSNDNSLYCLDLNSGREQWNYSTSGILSSTPAVFDGFVYVVSTDGNVYCMDLELGSLQWMYSIGGFVTSSPLVSDNKVYIAQGVDNAYLFCLDAKGNGDGSTDVLWSTQLDASVKASPAIADGKIFINSKWRMYCFDADSGEEQWYYSTGDSFMYESSPAVADGKLYFGSGSSSGTLFCLNSETSQLLWSYNIGNPVRSSPAIADGNLYVGSHDGKLYCFGDNTLDPPEQPDGSTSGEVDEIYTYSVTYIVDIDEIEYQFDWGDGSKSQWLSDPEAQHSWAASGLYSVKARIKDSTDTVSEWSAALSVQITDVSLPSLHLEVDSPLISNQAFLVVTTDEDNNPVEGVTITFDETIQVSDNQGSVTFTAPSVSSNTLFTMSAMKESYQGTTASILVKPEQAEEVGYIFGVVANDQGENMEGATVCLSSSSTSTCIKTDNDGNYVVSLTPGSYSIKASMKAYLPKIKYGYTIEANEALEINFILPTKTNDGSADSVTLLIEEKAADIIGAYVRVAGDSIEEYIEGLSVDVSTTDKTVTCDLSGSEDIPGTIIAVDMQDFFSSSDDLYIECDGKELQKIDDVNDFFATAPASNAWTQEGDTVFVQVLSFSEHSFTISSMIETIGGLTALLLYICIGIIVSLGFVTPVAVRFIRRLYFYKNL